MRNTLMVGITMNTVNRITAGARQRNTNRPRPFLLIHARIFLSP